jgi:hypothetical protein
VQDQPSVLDDHSVEGNISSTCFISFIRSLA